MLKGIPEIIGSDLLKALADMGHGDILVVAVLPQLSVIIVISHVPQLCFKQLLATPSIHCTFYHF